MQAMKCSAFLSAHTPHAARSSMPLTWVHTCVACSSVTECHPPRTALGRVARCHAVTPCTPCSVLCVRCMCVYRLLPCPRLRTAARAGCIRCRDVWMAARSGVRCSSAGSSRHRRRGTRTNRHRHTHMHAHARTLEGSHTYPHAHTRQTSAFTAIDPALFYPVIKKEDHGMHARLRDHTRGIKK